MSNILMLPPMGFASVNANRGSGVANLATFDPKEVWLDSAVGSAAYFVVDLGSVQSIDTVCLVALYGAADAATWAFSGGAAAPDTFLIQNTAPLRAQDAASTRPPISHALWHGDAVSVRYLGIAVTQPAGSPPLAIGRVLVGLAFVPTFNKEWGAGRRVIDMGSSTALPSGGFAVAPGARKGSYSWTLGDLSNTEVDRLYDLQLAYGETSPLLVAEDPDRSAGQRFRIHYGLMRSLKAYERREAERTRWEIMVEQWV